MASDVEVIDSDKGIFTVNGSGDNKYTIDFGADKGMPSCGCADWKQWNLNLPCKHMFAVFQLVLRWNWYKLPKSYLESPYLSTDNEALTAYFEEEGIVGAQIEEHSSALNLDEKEGEGCSTNYQWSELPSKSKVFSQSHLTPIFTESFI